MTPIEEGALLNDVSWIKETLKMHVNDGDQKNIGAYKKMTWLNFAGVIGIALRSLWSN